MGGLALIDGPLGYSLERLASMRSEAEVCQGGRASYGAMERQVVCRE